MVSNTAIAAICFTLCVSLLLPIVVFIVYSIKHRRKKVMSAWLLGAAGFFLFQILIRLPLISLLGSGGVLMSVMQNSILVYFLLLAVTAALSEVIARWLNAWIMRKNLNYERAFAAGLGHGGIEAIILIGVTYINNLIYALMINNGTFSAMMAQAQAIGADVSEMLLIQQELIQLSPMLYLLAGYERVLTMICQLSLTLLVCYYYSRKKTGKGLLICFGAHFLLDFVAPYVSNLYGLYGIGSQTLWYALVYLFLTAAAVIALFWIRYVKKNWTGAVMEENAVSDVIPEETTETVLAETAEKDPAEAEKDE